MPSQHDVSARRRAFRQLHESGCFVIPNPWDAGSAKYLEKLGFKALATTSSGAAWRHAKADGGMALDEVLVHLREMVARHRPAGERRFRGRLRGGRRRRGAQRAPCSRDRRGRPVDRGLDGRRGRAAARFGGGVDRMRAARAAIDEAGGDTLLVGRAENFIVGRPDLDDAIRRLQAYAEAGADCLYAPGIRTPRADRRGGGGRGAEAGQPARRLRH